MLDGGFDECTVYFRSDRFDKPFIGRKADVAHVYFGYAVDDAGVVRGDYLRAVVPVGFVPVVLGRVVGGGDDDTALGVQVTDGEGDLRRGAEAVEQIGFDAVGREDFGAHPGEGVGIVADVAADHHRDRFPGELFLQVVGQSLGGGADGVTVHAVGAYAHDAAHAAGAEFEVLVEGIDQFVGSLVYHLLNLLACLLVVLVGKPRLGSLQR